MKEIKFYKLLIFVNGLVPLALMSWDAARGRLGANPVEFATRTTGMLTLIFLLLSLAVTPLRKLTGVQWLIRFRRMIGLYAFFYGLLHFVTYLWFDRFFDFRGTVADIVQRPFIAVGVLSFFLLVPLAVTSTNKMIKRLGGKRWARLHKAAYAAAAGGVLHYYLLVKSDVWWPLAFGVLLAALLGYRMVAANLNQKTLSPVPPRTSNS